MAIIAPFMVLVVALAFFAAIGFWAYVQIRGTAKSKDRVIRQAVREIQAGRPEVQLPGGCGMSPEEVVWFAEQNRYVVREWPGAYRYFYLLVPGAPLVGSSSSVPHPPQPPPPIGGGEQPYRNYIPQYAATPTHFGSADRIKIRRALAREKSGKGNKYRIIIVAAFATLMAVLSIETYVAGNEAFVMMAILSAIGYFASIVGTILYLDARKNARQ